MKVNFTKTVKFIPTWNENDKLPESEQCTVLLNTMTFGDLMSALSSIPRGQLNADDTKQREESALAINKTAVQYLPKYAHLTNLEDGDGVVTVETITSYAQYAPLCVEIFMKLLSISSPSEDDAKN